MQQDIDITGENDGHGHSEHGHLVTVRIDGSEKRIQARTYEVADLKQLLGVPPEKALDQISHGTIHPLDDDAKVKITGDEHFISHVRCGGSS